MVTRSSNKWLVLGIDLFTVAIAFFLAYFIRFNLSLSFDTSLLATQVPLVVLIALAAFLITGSFKGGLQHKSASDVYNIFIATFLTVFLIIILILINRTWEIYPKLSMPLSIIIIFWVLSLLGLIASRYVFKRINALATKDPQ